MGNKSTTYLNLLPKEIRLCILDYLDVNDFNNYKEYISDVVDTDYIILFNKYDEINIITRHFPEIKSMFTWEAMYSCFKTEINLKYYTEQIGTADRRLYDFFFLFEVKKHYPKFYNEMLRIYLLYSHDLNIWLELGNTLSNLCILCIRFLKRILSGVPLGKSDILDNEHFYHVTNSILLMYDLIKMYPNEIRRMMWVRWNDHYSYHILSKMFKLKTTKWLRHFNKVDLVNIYSKLLRPDKNMKSYIRINRSFKYEAMPIIKSELIRRENLIVASRND